MNIGPNLAKNIELYPGKDSSSFFRIGSVNSIDLNPVKKNEIMYIVSEFRNEHSCGYDDVNMVFVKNLFKALYNLSRIFVTIH